MPVDQHSLRSVRLASPEGAVRARAVFPFFGPQLGVRYLLLVLHDRSLVVTRDLPGKASGRVLRYTPSVRGGRDRAFRRRLGWRAASGSRSFGGVRRSSSPGSRPPARPTTLPRTRTPCSRRSATASSTDSPSAPARGDSRTSSAGGASTTPRAPSPARSGDPTRSGSGPTSPRNARGPLRSARASLPSSRPRKTGAFDRALRAHEGAVDAARKSGRKDLLALALTHLGHTRRYRGEPARALPAYAEALALRRELGERRRVLLASSDGRSA